MHRLLSTKIHLLPHDKLTKSEFAFNPTIAKHQHGYVIVYRANNKGEKSNLSAAHLDKDFKVLDSKPIDVHREFYAEDPRLFTHDGQLHLAYNDGGRQSLSTFDPDNLTAKHLVRIEYHRNEVEKNFQWFTNEENKLACIYSVNPTIILGFDRNFEAEVLSERQTNIPWRWPIRGGASPVNLGGRLWCFFHSNYRCNFEELCPHRMATMGLFAMQERDYTIDWVTAHPLLYPDVHDLRGEFLAPVIFPCGAVCDGNRWIVSYGHNDYQCRIVTWDRRELEAEG